MEVGGMTRDTLQMETCGLTAVVRLDKAEAAAARAECRCVYCVGELSRRERAWANSRCVCLVMMQGSARRDLVKLTQVDTAADGGPAGAPQSGRW